MCVCERKRACVHTRVCACARVCRVCLFVCVPFSSLIVIQLYKLK